MEKATFAVDWDNVFSADSRLSLDVVPQADKILHSGLTTNFLKDFEPSVLTPKICKEYFAREKKDDFLAHVSSKVGFGNGILPFCDRHEKRPKFTSLNIFGDSLSDTGNLSTFTYLGSGGQFWFPLSPPLPSTNPPFGGPYYSKAPYYNSVKGWEKRHFLSPSGITPFTPGDPPEVRASNGRIWADFFPKDLGLRPHQVSDYAYAGATTGSDNGLQPFLPKPLDKLLPGLLTEIDNFVAKPGKADPKGLYVVWAGANDGFNLAGLFASSNPPSDPLTIPTAIKTAVNNIGTAITELAKEGAKIFLLPNLPDLGKTPLLSQNSGLSSVGTTFSVGFNAALAAEIPTLEQSLKIDIVAPNVYDLTEDALTNPRKYGFSNITDPLIAQDPLNRKVKPDKFFWYDYQHPTTAVHQELADFFQDNLFAAGYGNHGSTGKPDKEYLGAGDLLKQEQPFGWDDPSRLIPGAFPETVFSSVNPAEIPI